MTETGIREGHQIFTNELTRFAQRSGDHRMSTLIDRLGGPLSVAVRGRQGVGRSTVAAALSDVGLSVTDDDTTPDVGVVVVAEAVKPEDRAMLGSWRPRCPMVVVLNKADLAGFGAGGPLGVADRRAVELQAMTGVPTVPMVGLLATAVLDDELLGALRVLAAEPADLTSADAFVSAQHSVPRDVRARLLNTFDLFGIAHCVLALRQGPDSGALAALLRGLSRLDRVVAQVTAAGAQVRYQRMQAALVELRAMAARSAALSEFLRSDDAVVAVMAAAVDVVSAAGLTVDAGDSMAAHLQRARHWHRYSRGPVNRLHRSCGADICRGSLRMLRRVRSGPEAR